MNRSFLIIACCILMLAACTKRTTNAAVDSKSTRPPYVDSTIQFDIEDFSPQTLHWPDSLKIPLSVIYKSGKKEVVYLSTSYLPNDLKLTFKPASGTPPFSSVLTVKPGPNVAGLHSLRINAIRHSGAKNEYLLPVDFHGPETCAADRKGIYTNYQTGPSSAAGTGETVVEALGAARTIRLKNLLFIDGFLEDADADVHFYLRSVTIISKLTTSAPGFFLSGKGTFTDSTIKLGLIMENLSSGDTTRYTIDMKRK